MKERFKNALHQRDVDKVPALSVTQTGTVEFMEATGSWWPDAHYDAKKMVDLAMAGHEIGGLEAVRIPYCLTVLAEVVGCGVREGSEDTQPSVDTHPEEMGIPDSLEEAGRVPEILKATEMAKEITDGEVPIIVGIEAPDELAAHVMGSSNYIKGLITNPEHIEQTLEQANKLSIEYAQLVLDSGADAVCVPGYSTLDIVDPNSFQNLIKPTYKEFANQVEGDVIMHMCGHITQIIDDLADCGFQGISVEELTDIQEAKKIIDGRASLIGNISTSQTMLDGTPQQVKKEAKKCLQDGVDILAPGCGIAPRTPTKNIKALIQARNEHQK
ncbi:methylcobamide:CoM methyltransferase MtaA [Methanonatronarchaeum sp. AMET-Sl]|nr:methylcobamide:CoM methyltransferase MtaA [Methanonatronarchaeum sp. AMET-Sl]WGI17696.1 methylcobamide:CoM methyltransferase MtaA [Methanonatronarchaeum sp. AMET-Sl]